MNEKPLTEVRETLLAERAELKVEGAMKGLKINTVNYRVAVRLIHCLFFLRTMNQVVKPIYTHAIQKRKRPSIDVGSPRMKHPR